MKTYISSSDCRAVIIGRYFSDDTITDCGICDNCRQKKKAPEAVEPVAAQIRMALQTSRKEKLSSLRAGIQVSCNDDTWWKTLTWLEENGQISITEDGMVRWL